MSAGQREPGAVASNNTPAPARAKRGEWLWPQTLLWRRKPASMRLRAWHHGAVYG
jgi:hypothetical protein